MYQVISKQFLYWPYITNIKAESLVKNFLAALCSVHYNNFNNLQTSTLQDIRDPKSCDQQFRNRISALKNIFLIRSFSVLTRLGRLIIPSQSLSNGIFMQWRSNTKFNLDHKGFGTNLISQITWIANNLFAWVHLEKNISKRN